MKRRTFLASGLAVGIAGCNDRSDNGSGGCPHSSAKNSNPNGNSPCGDNKDDHTYTLSPCESVRGTFTVTLEEKGDYIVKVMTDDDSDETEVTYG